MELLGCCGPTRMQLQIIAMIVQSDTCLPSYPSSTLPMLSPSDASSYRPHAALAVNEPVVSSPCAHTFRNFIDVNLQPSLVRLYLNWYGPPNA
jgi:hypothetical protein